MDWFFARGTIPSRLLSTLPSLPPAAFFLSLPFLPLSPRFNSQPSLPVRVFVSIFPASRKNCNCIKDAPSRVPWSRANLPAISIYLLIDSLQWNLASRVDDIRRFELSATGGGGGRCIHLRYIRGRPSLRRRSFLYFDRDRGSNRSNVTFCSQSDVLNFTIFLAISFDVRSSDLRSLRRCVNSQFIFKRLLSSRVPRERWINATRCSAFRVIDSHHLCYNLT